MGFELIEASSISKNRDPEANEDGYFFSEELVAVYDGATSKTEQAVGGKKSGVFIRQWLDGYFADNVANLKPNTFLDEMSQSFAKTLSEMNANPPFPSCSIAVFFAKELRIICIGDMQVRINNSTIWNGTKKIDAVLAEARSIWHQVNPSQAQTVSDGGRTFILPILSTQYKLQNNCDSSYGYGAINGSKIPERFIGNFNIPAKCEIICASDGYPTVAPSLHESEKELKTILNDDPMLIETVKATKGLLPGNDSFDDRTYVKLRCLD